MTLGQMEQYDCAASNFKVKNTFIHLKPDALLPDGAVFDLEDDNLFNDIITPWIRHHSEPSPCTARQLSSKVQTLAPTPACDDSTEDSEVGDLSMCEPEMEPYFDEGGLARQETEQAWPTWQPAMFVGEQMEEMPLEPINDCPQYQPVYANLDASMVCGYALPPYPVVQFPAAGTWGEKKVKEGVPANKNNRRKGRSLIDRARREQQMNEQGLEQEQSADLPVDTKSWADTPVEAAATVVPADTSRAASKEGVSKSPKFCHNCGGETQPNFKFCRFCGTHVLK